MAPIPKTGLGSVATPKAPEKIEAPLLPDRPSLPALPEPPKRLPSTRFDTSRKAPLALTKSLRFKAAVPADPQLPSFKGFSAQISAGTTKPTSNLLAADPNATQASKVSTGFGQKSASGKVSAEQWADPTKLVGNLTQYPASGKTPQSQAACSAANLIGAAFLSGGPDAAAKVMKNVAKDGGQLTDGEKKELASIADKVANKTATFEELNKAQELMYRSANYEATPSDVVAMVKESKTFGAKDMKKLEDMIQRYAEGTVMSRDEKELKQINEMVGKALKGKVSFSETGIAVEGDRRTKDNSGLTDGELQSLGRAAVNAETKSLVPGEDIKKLADKLKPGESLTLRVAGDKTHADPDHYVTIGRRPNGQMYIYNPDPGKGDSALVVGGQKPDKAFNAQLERYQLRLKPEVITRKDMPDERRQPPGLQSKW